MRPRRQTRGPLGLFFRAFNRWFVRATNGYVSASAHLIRKSAVALALLAVAAVLA